MYDNMIAKIEGLDSLRDLRDLDLSNNRLCKIENVAHLTSLECLCIDVGTRNYSAFKPEFFRAILSGS